VTHKVLYLDGFWEDVQDAAMWYEQRQAGLGSAVAFEVSEAITRVIEAPERYRTVHHEVRSARTRRFPYSILYLTEADVVAFVGLKHGAQDMRRFIARRTGDG